MPILPIHSVLAELREALSQRHVAILEAPPGAGKTTVVPLALLEEPWLQGQRIVMLEPRRIAARNAARFMAASLSQAPGDTVGYRIRHETKVSARTRIEVVTEGILARMLQEDPALEGIGLVIFDEFHERNLQADLGLALLLDARENLRNDIGVLVMSATLDGARVAALLDGAPVVCTQGRQYDVDTQYSHSTDDDIAVATARAARDLMQEASGSLLAFLPGTGEIRRAAAWLEENSAGFDIAPLYGDLSPGEQDKAIRPAPSGRRKLVLATNIAESSLTIEGVRLVVDSGLERAPEFDPPSGMTRLVTRRISQASADQRRGRAGRTEEGICLRLWRESDTARLAPHAPPEIRIADLAGLALELANWGVSDPRDLRWLDPPPAAAFSQARELLADLGALDSDGRITTAGRAMLALPVHPRLAHMLLRAKEKSLLVLGALLAVIIEERDPLPALKDADLGLRLRALQSGQGISRGVRERMLQAAEQIAIRTAGTVVDLRGALQRLKVERAGYLVAEAYPDRIARRRDGREPRYQMAGGRGASLHESDSLSQKPWLAVAKVAGGGREARIFLAAELAADDIAVLEAEAGENVQVAFDREAGAVMARRVRRVGALVLESHPVPLPAHAALPALLDGIRELGLQRLPWNSTLRILCARVETLRALEPDAWPASDEAALAANLDEWLAPFLAGATRIGDISTETLREALRYRLGHARLRRLEQEAPEEFTLPSGKRLRIDYAHDVPVLAGRVQQFFGVRQTPSIAGGRIPLMLHLLSPANRPVQQTRDLASFWANTYPDVRKDLRGRYPKHAWPENPFEGQ